MVPSERVGCVGDHVFPRMEIFDSETTQLISSPLLPFPSSAGIARVIGDRVPAPIKPDTNEPALIAATTTAAIVGSRSRFPQQ